MVGDSSGHREDSPSKCILRRIPCKRKAKDGSMDAGPGDIERDPREAVTEAAEKGRLDPTQAKALLDLTSRMGVLGFEIGHIISTLVTEIALEDSASKRTKLAMKLKGHLEGDGLAKDLVPVLSGAFALG